MNCAICRTAMIFHASARVLGNHDARYERCPHCGFVAVADPFWLAEAYASPIASVDIGSVWRADRYSKVVKSLIDFGGFDRAGTFLDYGAGYGLFVRHMRDLGYDFRYHDTHCENLFARGFEADLARGERFEMVTAFEVFEHLQDPVTIIEQMTRLAPTLVFSTVLVADPAPSIGEWWYYMPSTGQHVSFYSRRSLELLARRIGWQFRSGGREIHMLSSKPIPAWAFSLLAQPRLAQWLALVWKRPTLLDQDFERGLSALRSV